MNKARNPNSKQSSITKKEVLEVFEYRYNKLFWKKTRKDLIGKQAGWVDAKGYRCVKLLGKQYQVHRLIFLINHGYMPYMVDHKDNDPSNNKIDNLRAADHGENRRNATVNSNNTSGVKGVSWWEQRKKWRARITFNNKVIVIGFFDSLVEAEKAIKSARIEIHGDFARLK